MKSAVLLSKHHKSLQLSPILGKVEIELVEINFFDTDQLGSFSGEISRKLSPKECALQKAKKAVELIGVNIGIGSEGSFGGGPLAGLINWNEEIVCLYQKEPELIIYGIAAGPTSLIGLKANSLDELKCQLLNFPQQKWLIRSDEHVIKGLTSQDVINLYRTILIETPIRIEPDLRAMHSPSRQEMITKAGLNLLARLQSTCPLCHHADFWSDNKEFGPPCKQCGEPTSEIKSAIYHCKSCQNIEKKIIKVIGEPYYCTYCNP